MELNDKLINYLDLSTFQQNILNDASVSEKATWTSLKINSEIEVLVNDISTLQWTCIDDISTLKNDVDASLALKADKSELEDYATLNDVSSYATEEYVDTAIAGVGGDAIEDVSILPDASLNKNKFVRLESNDNVYVPNLKSITTRTYTSVLTNDAQLIDKALLNDTHIYKGLYELFSGDYVFYGYCWRDVDNDNETRIYITKDNAVNSTKQTKAFYITWNDINDIDSDEHWIALIDEDFVASLNWDEINTTIGDYASVIIKATDNKSESAQINNAEILNNNGFWVYTGLTQVFTDASQNTYTGYTWYDEDNNSYLLTTKKASEIYTSISDNKMLLYMNARIWNLSSSSYITIKPVEDEWVEILQNFRTDINIVEENTWESITDIATNADIDLIFSGPVVKRTLVRYQNNRGVASNYVDLLVNINGETMRWDGSTYYKWQAYYANNEETHGNIRIDNHNIVLTNSLDIILPFNDLSPEFEYRIVTDGFDDEQIEEDYINGVYTKMELLHADGSITYEEV